MGRVVKNVLGEERGISACGLFKWLCFTTSFCESCLNGPDPVCFKIIGSCERLVLRGCSDMMSSLSGVGDKPKDDKGVHQI